MVGWMDACLAATSFLVFLFDLGGWSLPSFQQCYLSLSIVRTRVTVSQYGLMKKHVCEWKSETCLVSVLDGWLVSSGASTRLSFTPAPLSNLLVAFDQEKHFAATFNTKEFNFQHLLRPRLCNSHPSSWLNISSRVDQAALVMNYSNISLNLSEAECFYSWTYIPARRACVICL